MKKKNKTRILLLSISLLSVALFSESAFAASLTVKIRQVNPHGAAQQATCAENTKCPVEVNIHTGGKKEALTVNIHFVKDTLLAEFQTPTGFLYAVSTLSDNTAFYETIWHRLLADDKPSTEDVTLYLPEVRSAPAAPILNVAQEAAAKASHQPVATLEITIQRGP